MVLYYCLEDGFFGLDLEGQDIKCPRCGGLLKQEGTPKGPCLTEVKLLPQGPCQEQGREDLCVRRV